jgi:predicted MFS family arabinose efflux permease
MTTGNLLATVLGTVLAFCAGWGWPALLLLGVLTHHSARPAQASGRFQFGTALGAAAGPLVFGFVLAAADLRLAWLVIAACTAVAALLVVRVTRRSRSAGGTAPGPPVPAVAIGAGRLANSTTEDGATWLG